MEPWRTAITDTSNGEILIRGHDITKLMATASFADVVFLLSQSRLPTPAERALIDAILIAVADHGSGSPSAAAARLVASGNRQSFEAAVAGGVLAIGDAHGGAGYRCMEKIATGVEMAHREAIPLAEAARRLMQETLAASRRMPGLGHRTHTVDPRAALLFRMMAESDLAGDGVALIVALADAAEELLGRRLPINVDGAIAAVLYDLGFTSPLAKALFIIGRTAGLTVQVLEEYKREKPMRIRVPTIYDGPPKQE